tara:strand:+ start:4651 stop:4923 length:273 start_codon:yes stop_codon:yes gene_type:complete
MDNLTIFKNIPEKISIEKNKILYNDLLNKLTEKEWRNLINCWQKNSSLLRFNSTKTEFKKIPDLNHSKYYDILSLWLQYYTDHQTYKSTN